MRGCSSTMYLVIPALLTKDLPVQWAGVDASLRGGCLACFKVLAGFILIHIGEDSRALLPCRLRHLHCRIKRQPFGMGSWQGT